MPRTGGGELGEDCKDEVEEEKVQQVSDQPCIEQTVGFPDTRDYTA